MPIKHYALILFICLLSISPAFSWTIDPSQSSVSFTSIKKNNIAENHRFTDFSGDIAEGRATVAIKPDSVDSRVPIRDERMREFLFETELFPVIEVNAEVKDILDTLSFGESKLIDLPASLAMHGESKEVSLAVRVTAISESKLSVTTTKPVLIRAADYKMVEGIQTLSSLVNNLPIAESVPVSFSLMFVQ